MSELNISASISLETPTSQHEVIGGMFEGVTNTRAHPSNVLSLTELNSDNDRQSLSTVNNNSLVSDNCPFICADQPI